MIVGNAICKILDGMTIDVNGQTIVIQNNLGNQDALDKFIAARDEVSQDKFPLVFYVIAPVKEFDLWKYCDTELIIMVSTKEPSTYKDRTDETYIPYIEPIYQKIKTLLTQNPYFQNLDSNENKFSYVDVPNYGISGNNVGGSKSNESVVTEYVDARKIKLNFKLKTNCI